MKKDVEAAEKPLPEVAKEPSPEPAAETAEPVKAEPVKETPAAAPPAPQPEPASSAFWPLVTGGLVAAAIGFFAAQLNLFSDQSAANKLQAQVERQGHRITQLEEVEPAAPASAPVADPEMAEKLAALASQVNDLSAQLAALDERLVVVEKQPVSEGDGASAAAIAAYERELSTLRETVAGMIENARSVEAATADSAKEAQVREALAAITTAIGTGQPFSDALSALQDAGVADVPGVLSDVSDSGVATLANLQDRFADTARTALSTARASGAMEEETGVGGFLRRQLGARSVAPREGAGPDAVLSRAEAAMRDGQLATALTELDGLSEDIQASIVGWLTDARANVDATAAAKSISQSLTAN